MLTQTAAAKELTKLCVRKRVAGEDTNKDISMPKRFSGGTSCYVPGTCIQLHRGFGYMKLMDQPRRDRTLLLAGSGAPP